MLASCKEKKMFIFGEHRNITPIINVQTN